MNDPSSFCFLPKVKMKVNAFSFQIRSGWNVLSFNKKIVHQWLAAISVSILHYLLTCRRIISWDTKPKSGWNPPKECRPELNNLPTVFLWYLVVTPFKSNLTNQDISQSLSQTRMILFDTWMGGFWKPNLNWIFVSDQVKRKMKSSRMNEWMNHEA